MPEDEDDIFDRIHTAQDVADERQVVYIWRAHTGNVDAAQRFLDQIREIAIGLGLEAP